VIVANKDFDRHGAKVVSADSAMLVETSHKLQVRKVGVSGANKDFDRHVGISGKNGVKVRLGEKESAGIAESVKGLDKPSVAVSAGQSRRELAIPTAEALDDPRNLSRAIGPEAALVLAAPENHK